jgi:hypothetical protein
VISIDTLRWTLRRKKKEKKGREGGIIDEKAKKR